MAAYQGASRQADGAVGAILAALRQSGLDRDTIVVFTTDHGMEMPRAKWFACWKARGRRSCS
jgi:arylsulfatase A-like enzyme